MKEGQSKNYQWKMLTEKTKLSYNYIGRNHRLNRFDMINNNF